MCYLQKETPSSAKLKDAESESGDESDGYGNEGLSWEAVLESMKVMSEVSVCLSQT